MQVHIPLSERNCWIICLLLFFFFLLKFFLSLKIDILFSNNISQLQFLIWLLHPVTLFFLCDPSLPPFCPSLENREKALLFCASCWSHQNQTYLCDFEDSLVYTVSFSTVTTTQRHCFKTITTKNRTTTTTTTQQTGIYGIIIKQRHTYQNRIKLKEKAPAWLLNVQWVV